MIVKDEQFLRVQVPDVGYFDESVLLSDNSALTYTIPEGQHDYIIDLGQFMKVSRFFFNNESASGTMQLMSSNALDPLETGKWVKLTPLIAFQQGDIPSTTFAEVDTRYLLVRFNIIGEGRIATFAHHVVEVTHWDHVRDLENVPAGHQQLRHHLQSRALALQQPGQGNQRVDECR